MTLRRASALALGLSLAGCPDGSRAKSEAAAVNRAVTALREADNARKGAFLPALREVPCSTEDICAVRSACLAAYELHTRTLERASEAVAGTGAPGSASFDTLERDLARARELTRACTDAEGEMIRRYALAK